MCLILFAKNKHPQYKLILAANRDEFFERPTLAADFWEDNSNILGGRDRQSMGTWLGMNKNGRFIAITNFRDPKMGQKSAKSRGILSKNFLSTELDVSSFINEVSADKELYNGFNLLMSIDGFKTLFHYSNISDMTTKLKDGIYGLSNHLLDTSWPKVKTGKNKLSEIMKSNAINNKDLIEILKDGEKAPDDLLPDTGISFDLEKKLSPVFISMKGYGTRCSTAMLVNNDNELSFLEVTYNEKREVISEKQYDLMLKP